MKVTIAVVATILTLAFQGYASDTNTFPATGMQPGMAGCFGTEQAQVVKVFAAEDNGARFRAYQVKWKDQDVIVSDTFGTTDFKEGDTITFMANNMEIPAGDKKLKMLQFMMMDTKAFMPKQQSVEPPPSPYAKPGAAD